MAKASIRPFFVSYGSEPFLLDRDLAKAKAMPGRRAVVLDGEELGDVQVVEICETIPVDGSDQVIIVDNAHKMKGGKALSAYIEDKDVADTSTVLVAIVRSEKLPEVWGKAVVKGRLVVHQKLKTWGDNNEVVKWTIKEAFQMELTLDDEAAQFMFKALNGDLYSISSELQKLKLVCGSGKVPREQLLTIIAASPKTEPVEVADAATDKDIRGALNLLSSCYRVMGEEASVPITSSLSKQVERLLVARTMLDHGADETTIGPALDMHPYRCKVHLLPRAKKHTVAQLITHMRLLRKLDADVKGAAPSKRTLVEFAVLSIAR